MKLNTPFEIYALQQAYLERTSFRLKDKDNKLILEIIDYKNGEELAEEITRRINDWEYIHDVDHLNQIYSSEIEESVKEIEELKVLNRELVNVLKETWNMLDCCPSPEELTQRDRQLMYLKIRKALEKAEGA